MENQEIIPNITVDIENLDVDLKERLKNIIAGIQKISSKIAIGRIALRLFDKQDKFHNLCQELAKDEGVEEVVVVSFLSEQFCFVVRLPKSLLSNYPVYDINDAIIFGTFNRAFFFGGHNMERDEQEGHNEKTVFHPNFMTWEEAIKCIERLIKNLQDEIPKVEIPKTKEA